MAIAYTTLLGFAQPVTGTESGVWGTVVNDQITALVEDAVANAATIDVTSADVTLSATNGAVNQARMMILLVIGTPGASRNIIAPSKSKLYLVKNSSNANVVVKGAATTGATVLTSTSALMFWNGSDFEIININGPSSSTDNTIARFDGTTGKVLQGSGVSIDDSNNVSGVGTLGVTTVNATTVNATTVDATNVEVTNVKAKDGTAAITITDSTGVVGIGTLNLTNALGVGYGGTGLTSGTSGGVPYYSAAGTIASSAALASSSLVVGGGAGAAPATITTGTGVTAALGVNTGTAGAFVVNGGALGTPSSGALTNCTFPTLNQNTTGTAAGLSSTLVAGSGGTGQTTYTDGQLLIGNSVGNTLSKSTLTAGSNVTITNGNGTITIASANSGGTVTGVTATSPVASSGGTAPVISLDTAYGDTKNPYASKTANYVLAAPNGAAGVPTFRAIVAADIPTLNQNTSGTAAGLSATLAVGSGGPGITSGTSGGLLYYSAAGTIASSGSYTAGTLLIGAGSGSPPGSLTLGTGVNGAITTAVGSAGAFVVNGGVLGTPSSGTVTNLTGTASININGTVGATTPTTGSFTTVTTTGGVNVRSTAIANGTSITINADTTDIATQANTQAAGTLTINAPTGTITDGERVILRLTSTNVQTFSWNAVFAGSTDLSLPATSSGAGKTDYMGFIYNSTAAKWQIVAKNFGFS